MGRIGRWTVDGFVLTTPTIAFVDTDRFPAPPWCEAVATRKDPPPGKFAFTLAGSFFEPSEPRGGIPLPPRSGLPPGAASVEIPRESIRGPIAIASSVHQVKPEAPIEAVIVEGGPVFLEHPKEFVRTVVAFRESFGPSRLLFVPGLAAPEVLAVAVYAGLDVLDSSRVAMETALGLYETADGALPRASLEELPCRCPSCEKGGPLLEHNYHVLSQELATIRVAIRQGSLRELAERRAVNNAWSTAVLREFDLRHYDFQEPNFPVSNGIVRAYSTQSLTRPDVVRFRRFVASGYEKPPSARILLLLPCSARKPYAESNTHRRFRRAIEACGNPNAIHQVIVTSPLGLVPRELERAYPAAHYDIPVTGDWSRDEVAMLEDSLASFIARNPYQAVVAHVATEAPFVAGAIPDAVFTAGDRPASDESLTGLTEALWKLTDGTPRVGRTARSLEDVSSLARFQFGTTGRAFMEGTTLRGRWPFGRLMRGGTQVGAVSERGLIAVSVAGGEILRQHNAFCVEIEDFEPRGNIFAVGVVHASSEIRVGSDVAVVHDAEVRAVGVARMNARELVDLERGEAVRVRHRARGLKA